MTSRLLVDAIAIVRDLKRELGVDVSPGTIRMWASRGRVGQYGSDARGRTLYDYDEIAAIVAPRSSTTGVPGADDGAGLSCSSGRSR